MIQATPHSRRRRAAGDVLHSSCRAPMPTQNDPVKLTYLVSYDRQTPRVGVEYASPIDGSTQQQTVEITEPAILAKIEELHAMVAEAKGLDRAPAPDAPTEEPTQETQTDVG